MTFESLIDGPSALIVIGGTVLATVLRSGWRECAVAAREIAHLWGTPFVPGEARAELARQVQDIRQDGLLRATHHHTGDPELDDATDALFHKRSIAALVAAHEKHKARRLAMSNTAVRLFAQAAELAPVFGMVGTLVSLNHLPQELANGDYSGAIGMAVLTTLYGLLAANLIFAPIARLIERAANKEEAQRQEVVEWLTAQLADAGTPIGPFERRRAQQEAA
ncbi:MotA/TolQ/ExbB proton channel family protein [Novosphingobium sp. TH158]|uniref:MotA/TolQ/ExbB proton channel family protein n=1 Tax=Novosphingobium sp. TH158 TaxID=2067455 RepID=UPI000C7DB5BD|nr:MotA/TolQ/ExbB proton channel family protein [Novosphingobium sp. TH158]PLK27973.1 chemotaxis protein MotA [Novosphingobium sp. TH158]